VIFPHFWASHSFIVLILFCGGGSIQTLLEKTKQRQVEILARSYSLQTQSVLEIHPYLNGSQSWDDYLKEKKFGVWNLLHLGSNSCSTTKLCEFG
jgi:hypothetical protein